MEQVVGSMRVADIGDAPHSHILLKNSNYVAFFLERIYLRRLSFFFFIASKCFLEVSQFLGPETYK